jgi:hypothetical protein
VDTMTALPGEHVKCAYTKFGLWDAQKPPGIGLEPSPNPPQMQHATWPCMVLGRNKTCQLCWHPPVYGGRRLVGVGFYPDGKRPTNSTPIFIRTLAPGLRPNSRHFYPDRLKGVYDFRVIFIRTLQRPLSGMSGVLMAPPDRCVNSWRFGAGPCVEVPRTSSSTGCFFLGLVHSTY